jgi:hypothetical protein
MDGFREIPRGGGMAENVAYHAMEPVSLARIQPRVRHLEREVRVQTRVNEVLKEEPIHHPTVA